MPGFVKTNRDEKIWAKAKRRAAKSLGKSSSISGDDYRLANWLYHKMKKAHPAGRLPKHYDESKQVRVVQRVEVEEDWFCPHCEAKIEERGSLFYNKARQTYEHRQCGMDIMLPKQEADKKGCTCSPGKSCDCWAFAPLYGDGKGHSLATIPYNNVINQNGPEAPAATNPAAGSSAPTAGGTTVTGAVSGAGVGGGAVTASKDTEAYEMEASMDPLADLNEDLEFLDRMIQTPTIVFPDDPDEDPNRNPMIMDDVEDPLADDLFAGPIDNPVSPLPQVTVPVSGPDVEALYADLNLGAPVQDWDDMVTLDDIDDLDGFDVDAMGVDPDSDDVLDAVLTLLQASVR